MNQYTHIDPEIPTNATHRLIHILTVTQLNMISLRKKLKSLYRKILRKQ